MTVPGAPSATVVIPTRRRADYLDVALRSVVPQARTESAEVVVLSDGPDAATAEIASRHGVSTLSLPNPRGLNSVRNAAVEAARGALIVFIDDDVITPPGWLRAYLSGAEANVEHDVFGGPIEARLEGPARRACGRERPPITNLDLGEADRDVSLVWGANMAIRSSALHRIGPFDETIVGTGDEEEWLGRYLESGGRIRYLAAARLIHRRSAPDSRVSRLARAAYVRGQAARRYDARRGRAPLIRSELRTLLGCGWHAIRRRCPLGIVSAAHTAGRLRQALAEPTSTRARGGASPSAAPPA